MNLTTMRLLLVLAGIGLTSSAFAQQLERVKIDLRDAAFAEIDPDDDSILTIESNRVDPVKRRRVTPVTRWRTEARTRVVLVDGEQKEQTYLVKIPLTEMTVQEYSVEHTDATQRAAFDLSQVKLWNLSGESVPAEEIKSRVPKRFPVILLQSPWDDSQPLTEAQAAVLREGTLLLYPETAVWRSGEPQE
ncbi:hypothetical protein FYK55_03560 [Roseiconus nitratireducens]|uniref:Uncharacterized protein n=1 Tax=Roseiconus nitratireducens TaxID=2605748 RepID=A0A5M6DEP6_9BACT|nr:hypothetical protein [Roseiconus nitratireducens]KAA5545997.1 hypothetical protein FYK55_03560 [Roseiconus nitratireducens]